MSVFDLDQKGQQAIAEEARLNPLDTSQVKPGAFTGVGTGISSGVMRGGAKVGQFIGMAGAVVPMAIDKLTEGDNFSGQSLTDSYFEGLDKTVNRAVDHWTPSAAEVGKVGHVLGGLSEIVLPLMAGGGNPTLLIGSQEMGTATDLVRQGVDADTAAKAGLLQGGATAIGFRLPAAFGSTLAQRLATGAGVNLAVGVPQRAATASLLEAAKRPDLADAYGNSTDALAVDVLTGLVFGGLAHVQAPKFKPSDADAVLTASNAKHFQHDTAPGTPADPAASAAHQSAMATAIQQLVRGERVNVAEAITEADFIKKPESPIGAAILEAYGIETPKPISGARGIRNNNPGNLEIGPQAWQGQIAGNDPRFATFETPEAGIRALAKNLITYQDKHGLNTVEGIINRWAPPGENKTSSYVQAVAKELGVKPGDVLNVRDPETLTRLTSAIIRHENGAQPYPAATIQAGVDAALSGRKVSAGGTVAKVDFDKFANDYVDGQPLDTYEHRRIYDQAYEDALSERRYGIEDLPKQNLAASSDVSPVERTNKGWTATVRGVEISVPGYMKKKAAPGAILARYNAKHAEPDASFFDDGELNQAGYDAIDKLNEDYAVAKAREVAGDPQKKHVDFSDPEHAAQVLRDYLDAEGFGPNVVGGSGKSRSKYFELDDGRIVRVSDHELPDHYTNDAAVEIILPQDSASALAEIKGVADRLISERSAAPANSRELGSRAQEGSGMQERPAVRADKSGSLEEPAQSGSAGGGRANTTAIRAEDATMFAKAYGDPEIVAMMAESTDANVKNILAGMLRAAPAVARLKDLIDAGARYPMDFTGDLVKAVRQFSQLRADGMTVDQFLAQRSLFDSGLSPEINNLLIGLQENAKAPKRVAEMIGRVVDTVDQLGDPRQSGMFDSLPTPKPHDVIADAVETMRAQAEIKPTGDLFNSPEIEAARQATDINPDMRVVLDDGTEVSAREAMARAADDIHQAKTDARAFMAAVTCYLRNL